MTRFVYLYSVIGAIALAWSFPHTTSATDTTTSKYAVSPVIIDNDPAPGRSPGPPRNDDSLAQLLYLSAVTPFSLPTMNNVDEQNYSSKDHTSRQRHRHQRHNRHQRPQHHQTPESTNEENGAGSAGEWAKVDNYNQHYQEEEEWQWQKKDQVQEELETKQLQHGINKLVALRVSTDTVEAAADNKDANSVAFQMNQQPRRRSAESTSSSASSSKGAAVSGESQPKRRSRRHEKKDDLSYYRYPGTSHNGQGGQKKAHNEDDSDALDDDDGDWQYVNLYCGGDTSEERENLRASFFNRLNEVVITMPAQDNRFLVLTPPLKVNNVGDNKNYIVGGVEQGQSPWMSMSAQQRIRQLTRSGGGSTKGTGDSTGQTSFSAAPAHRFQKVTPSMAEEKNSSDPLNESPAPPRPRPTEVVVNVDKKKTKTNATLTGQEQQQVAQPQQQQGRPGGVVAAAAAAASEHQEVDLMSWWRLKAPQSSLTSLNVNKDNDGQANNKLPLQFDVTHDVFLVGGGGGGLVADMEYTGEQFRRRRQ